MAATLAATNAGQYGPLGTTRRVSIRADQSWWRANSSRYKPTAIAPINSQTNPNIATRDSRRVPLRFIASATAIIATAIAVVTAGLTSAPINWATNGAPPVATDATVTQSAHP